MVTCIVRFPNDFRVAVIDSLQVFGLRGGDTMIVIGLMIRWNTFNDLQGFQKDRCKTLKDVVF